MAGVKLPKVKTPAQMKAEMAVGRARAPEVKTSRIDMSFKDVTKRTPELQEAAQRVAAGEMSAAEYDALVNQVKPVTPYNFVPTPATREEAVSALTANKKEKYGAAEEWEAGTPVGLRLDIPAYSDHGVWVNSIHSPDSTAYGNVSSVTDARFGNFDDKALKVAQGAAKSPFAKIEGKWNPIEEQEAVKRASEYLSNPEWRQVGMDPERHGYFYDRQTMEPIVASEEVIQIGPLVLAKNPVYGDKGDFKFAHGGIVKMGVGGLGKKGSKLLPKAEREVNLQQYMQGAAIPDRLYHATTATQGGKGEEALSTLKPSKDGALGSGIYMHPNPDYVNQYASGEGGNILPLYTNIKNPLFITGEHRDPMKEALIKLGVEPSKADTIVERAYEQKGYIGKEVQSRAQAAGYDGLVQMNGDEIGEVVSYSPNAVKSAIGNTGEYKPYSGDLGMAHGGIIKMGKGGLGRKAADKILPKVEAPSVMTRSELTELADYIKNREGEYGVRRVERAADEIPRLGEMYTPDALRSAFSGDNAQGLVIMNPKNFEDYAVPLPLQKDIRDLHKYESLIGDPSAHFDKYDLSTNDYVKHLSGVQNKGGFDAVPYLNVFSDEVGLGINPKIVGHEGRHRNRALAAENVPSGLVILRPSGDLREGLPRRHRDDYIEALRKEFSLAGNKVLPQTYTEPNPNSFDETLIRRPPIKISEPFANGGAVKMAEGGEADQAELDRMRLELSNSPVIQATPQSPFQRGIGALGGYMNQAGEFINKAVEPIAESNPVKTFIAELFGDSFKSAGTALQDYTKTSRDYTEDNPYKRAPITGSGQTMSLDPRMIDVIGFADPVARLGIKAGKAGVKAATPFAKDVGSMASEMYMRGDIPGMVSPNSFVIKPKDGNWITEEIDKAIDPLRIKIMGEDPTVRLQKLEDILAKQNSRLEESGASTNTDVLDRARARLEPDIAINNWLGTKLNKYIKNEMGTPEDSLRKLADQGKLHTSTDAFPRTFVDESADLSPTSYLGERRTEAGFPYKSYAETLEGKNWEASTDAAIQSKKAGDLLSLANAEKPFDSIKKLVDENPWLSKVDPDTNIYRLSPSTFADLNFSHVVDELKNSMRADSDLPEKLRIKPSKLEKMTVPQVVERVSEINKWRAENQAAANEKLANNAATQLVKDYPDQGYKWVELRKPEDLTELPEGFTVEPYKSEYSEGVKILRPDGTQASAGDTVDQALKNMSETMLDDALKYEGDTMGHCVGGYCADVLDGSTRIYSLRDSKGQPHVTIEVQPNPNPYAIGGQDFSRLSPTEKAEYGEHIRQWRRRNPDVEELTDDNINEALRDAGVPPRPDSIIQIKGKGNAKPKDTYLPFVQDFVKSGKWSEINDFKNTGLVHAGIGGELMTPAEHAVWLASRRDATPDGMKRGGKVQFAKSLDAMRHELTKAK